MKKKPLEMQIGLFLSPNRVIWKETPGWEGSLIRLQVEREWSNQPKNPQENKQNQEQMSPKVEFTITRNKRDGSLASNPSHSEAKQMRIPAKVARMEAMRPWKKNGAH